MSRQSSLVADKLSLYRQTRPVVNNVSVKIHSGDWISIVGPNGAGKSSLLSLLAGLTKPDSGSVQLNGKLLHDRTTFDRARSIAWLAQQGDADGDISARDVVALGRLPHHGMFGTPTADDKRAIDLAMQETECLTFARRRLGELSGGERQRVLLARTLAVESDVLLLDEPMTHLDPPHQRALLKTLSSRTQAGSAVVSVLHDLTIALIADRIWLMDKGQLRLDTTPDDPALHATLIDCFQGAIDIEKLERNGQTHFMTRPRI